MAFLPPPPGLARWPAAAAVGRACSPLRHAQRPPLSPAPPPPPHSPRWVPPRASDVAAGAASAAPAAASPPPPLIRGRSLAVSYSAAATAAAASITSAVVDGGATAVTVDVPPSRAESRSGTLVGRYEADLSFAVALLEALGAPEGAAGYERIGENVEIRHTNNPQVRVGR